MNYIVFGLAGFHSSVLFYKAYGAEMGVKAEGIAKTKKLFVFGPIIAGHTLMIFLLINKFFWLILN